LKETENHENSRSILPNLSAAGAGADKDSLKRKKVAVLALAKVNRIEVVREIYDAAVIGVDYVQDRDG